MSQTATLNAKQRQFVREYLADLNATQAATRSGYSARTAYSQGQRLLKHVDIARAIQTEMDRRAARTEITADRVLEELARQAFANIFDYVRVENGEARVDLSKVTREQATAIQEITVDEAAGGAGDGVRERVRRTRFKLADKGLALERLGRHLRLFTDKIEVSADQAVLDRLLAGRKRLG